MDGWISKAKSFFYFQAAITKQIQSNNNNTTSVIKRHKHLQFQNITEVTDMKNVVSNILKIRCNLICIRRIRSNKSADESMRVFCQAIIDSSCAGTRCEYFKVDLGLEKTNCLLLLIVLSTIEGCHFTKCVWSALNSPSLLWNCPPKKCSGINGTRCSS